MTEWEQQGWRLDVVRATPGTLCRGRQVLAVIDEAARHVVYQVDTTAPEEVWLKALSNAMTEMMSTWLYVGDVQPAAVGLRRVP